MDNNLQKFRHRFNKVEKEIAASLGITRRSYSHYEQGDRNIPITVLIQLADYFGTSTDNILNHKIRKNGYVYSHGKRKIIKK